MHLTPSLSLLAPPSDWIKMSPEEESFPCTVVYSYNFENAGNRDKVTHLAGRQLDRVVNGQLFWWVRRLLHKLWFQGPGALGAKEETEIWIASRAGRSGPRSGMRSTKTLTCSKCGRLLSSHGSFGQKRLSALAGSHARDENDFGFWA